MFRIWGKGILYIKYNGGFCPGNFVLGGDFAQGILIWGFCPGGFCPRIIATKLCTVIGFCIFHPKTKESVLFVSVSKF